MRRLMERRSSPLGSPEWLDVANVLSEPDGDHQLCNYGFQLSKIAQDCDNVLEPPKPSTVQMQALIVNTEQLFQSLDRWHQPCTCFEYQPMIGPQPASAEGCEPSFSSLSTVNRTLLVQCILLRGMQLLCCKLNAALTARMGLESVGVVDSHSRERCVDGIIHLSKVLADQDVARHDSLSRVSWALNLARQDSTLAQSGAAGCDALLQRFTAVMNSLTKMQRLEVGA